MTKSYQPAALPFTTASTRLANDHDVLMCYQVLLGRDPENSFVIQEAKTQPLRSIVESFLGSDEFANGVRQPLQRGQALPHEADSPGPSAAQLDWLQGEIVLPEPAAIALRQARSWRNLFGVLLGLAEAASPASSDPASLRLRIENLEGLVRQILKTIPDLAPLQETLPPTHPKLPWG